MFNIALVRFTEVLFKVFANFISGLLELYFSSATDFLHHNTNSYLHRGRALTMWSSSKQLLLVFSCQCQSQKSMRSTRAVCKSSDIARRSESNWEVGNYRFTDYFLYIKYHKYYVRVAYN